MPTKVVVIVSGGNVQNCHADAANVQVEIIDFDNIDTEGEEAFQRADARVSNMNDTMHHVY